MKKNPSIKNIFFTSAVAGLLCSTALTPYDALGQNIDLNQFDNNPSFSNPNAINNANSPRFNTDAIDTGLFIGFNGEAVFFITDDDDDDDDDDHDITTAPGVGFDIGYRGDSWSISTGMNYYFNNFLGGSNLLLHGEIHYILDVPLTDGIAMSWGLGAGVGHDFLTNYINKQRTESYFYAIPDTSLKFAFDSFVIGATARFYMPIKKPFEVGYGIQGNLDIVF